mgnify:FL=1
MRCDILFPVTFSIKQNEEEKKRFLLLDVEPIKKRHEIHVIYLMYSFILLTYVISLVHLLLALISIVVGIISQSRALVWMAHSVAPIWSGIFVSFEEEKKIIIQHLVFFLVCLKFALCGGVGIVCARQKSLYVVRSFICSSFVFNFICFSFDCTFRYYVTLH